LTGGYYFLDSLRITALYRGVYCKYSWSVRAIFIFIAFWFGKTLFSYEPRNFSVGSSVSEVDVYFLVLASGKDYITNIVLLYTFFTGQREKLINFDKRQREFVLDLANFFVHGNLVIAIFVLREHFSARC
jgi:hypothetical protein